MDHMDTEGSEFSSDDSSSESDKSEPSPTPDRENTTRTQPSPNQEDTTRTERETTLEEEELFKDGEYEVEEILKAIKILGEIFYKIKWLGYEEPTWIREEDAVGCEDKLEEFFKDNEILLVN